MLCGGEKFSYVVSVDWSQHSFPQEVTRVFVCDGQIVAGVIVRCQSCSSYPRLFAGK
jgi:hypothetical protein